MSRTLLLVILILALIVPIGREEPIEPVDITGDEPTADTTIQIEPPIEECEPTSVRRPIKKALRGFFFKRNEK